MGIQEGREDSGLASQQSHRENERSESEEEQPAGDGGNNPNKRNSVDVWLLFCMGYSLRFS